VNEAVMMMKKKIIKQMLIGFMVACLALTIGCSKLTTQNYDKIKMGMQYDEVIALLGQADQCDGAMGIKNCTWGDEDRHIKVNFAGDRVILFSAKGL
jgi:hypothetical protein